MTDQATRHLTPAEPPYDPDYDTDAGLHRIEADARLAERALLAALLIHPGDAAQLLPVLDPTDFHNPTYETVWNTAADIYADGKNPDQLAIQAALATDKNFIRFGGFAKLTELRIDNLEIAQAAIANPDFYAATVRNASRWRAATSLTTAAAAALRGADLDSIEKALQTAAELTERAALAFGPRVHTAEQTGMKDLGWLREGRPPATPTPKYVPRDDGTALFYEGKVNGLFGDPESGKSWLAQQAIVDALTADGTAAFIDVDHNGQDATCARLMLLGARPEHLWNPETFRYYEPEEGDELRAAVRDVTTWAPNVFVLDSLGEVLPLLGIASKDNDEITLALRAVVQPPADAGSCVITIDHLPKSTEARSTGFAIGGMAKKRAIRGAYLRVNSKTKPAPGQVGRSTLLIEKDTLGGLRATSAGGWAGELVIDSTVDLITRCTVTRDHAPVDASGRFRPTELMEQVSRFIEDNDQCTGSDIKNAVKGKHTTVDTALTILCNEGFVHRAQGARNAWRHHAVAIYREAEDDAVHGQDPPPTEELF